MGVWTDHAYICEMCHGTPACGKDWGLTFKRIKLDVNRYNYIYIRFYSIIFTLNRCY